MNNNAITAIPEISAEINDISVRFTNFPVKIIKGTNEFILIEGFGDTMIETIGKKYSPIKKGFFKKKYFCPQCKNELMNMESQHSRISDSLKVINHDLNFIFNTNLITCSHCSSKIFSNETNTLIFHVIEKACIDNKLWPEDPDD